MTLHLARVARAGESKASKAAAECANTNKIDLVSDLSNARVGQADERSVVAQLKLPSPCNQAQVHQTVRASPFCRDQ